MFVYFPCCYIASYRCTCVIWDAIDWHNTLNVYTVFSQSCVPRAVNPWHQQYYHHLLPTQLQEQTLSSNSNSKTCKHVWMTLSKLFTMSSRGPRVLFCFVWISAWSGLAALIFYSSSQILWTRSQSTPATLVYRRPDSPDQTQQAELPLWKRAAELILKWEGRSDRIRVSESPLKINEKCWWHSTADRSNISFRKGLWLLWSPSLENAGRGWNSQSRTSPGFNRECHREAIGLN